MCRWRTRRTFRGRASWLAAAWLAVATLAACGGASADGSLSDVAPDARVDGWNGPDATPDAALEPDAAPDTAPEPDAAPDTAPDTAPDAVSDAAADPDALPDPDGAPDPHPPYRNVLATAGDFAAVAVEGEVKWLAPVEGRTPPAPLDTAECWFQDMHVAEWHILFLRGFEELAGLSFDDYVTMVLDPEARVLWGGALAAYPDVRHPISQRRGVYAYTIYTDQERPNAMTVDDIVAVHGILARCAPFADDLLVFLAHGAAQKQFMAAAGPALDELGVPWLLPEQLAAGQPFVAYSEGEGYGTLRVVPRGEVLASDGFGPRDIVIVESAPNDIGVVQGLVTADPQNVHSHVNLRLTEKGVPNAAVPEIYDSAYVLALDGALVHLVVAATGVTFAPARLADAEAFWEARRPDVGAVRSDLTVTALAGFDALDAADAPAYGAKAANLGALHAVLPAENRVEGFGVPLVWYREFVRANGLEDAVAALVADPRMEEDRTYRTTALASLRGSLRRGRLPDGFEAVLHAQIRATFGPGAETTRLRFRSSTNAEDLALFSGAGLYDSHSGCLADDLDGDSLGPSRCLDDEERDQLLQERARRRVEWAAHPERTWLPAILAEIEDDLGQEKPVGDAVRKVWASLWNDRAWEERAYYGIDHQAVRMGLAVNEAFAMERVNAVAVTNLDGGGEGAPLYRVVSQVGEGSVVRPEDPLAIPEVLTFRRTGDPPVAAGVAVVVPSALVPEGERVWPEDAFAELARALFTVQDRFAAEVYPHLAPLRLDCEVKWTRDGRVVVKQARPYLGGSDPDPRSRR